MVDDDDLDYPLVTMVALECRDFSWNIWHADLLSVTSLWFRSNMDYIWARWIKNKNKTWDKLKINFPVSEVKYRGAVESAVWQFVVIETSRYLCVLIVPCVQKDWPASHCIFFGLFHFLLRADFCFNVQTFKFKFLKKQNRASNSFIS